MTDNPEHQLPIDTVEEAADIDIEHPVIAPAALTSGVHSLDCRFAGSVAVRVDMKHRLHSRLQIAPDDLLGDAVSDRRDAQRSCPTICLWNLDPPHRRRKVAP
jgi:hypothetical protein